MDQITQPIKKVGAGKVAVYIVLIVALALVAIVSIVRDRIVNYPQNSVSVTGQGKVTYQPDIAIVTLGVQIDKVAKPDEALNQLNDKITKVVAAIKALGIAPEDIVTQNYSLYPQYDYVNNVSSLSGYSANQLITVKVRDIKTVPDKVSRVIAEASRAGVNQVSGVSFDVSSLNDLKQQARVEALGDANAKAVKMASAADVKLGEITGWWENYVQGPGQGAMYYGGSDKGGMGGGSVSPNIPSGSYEIIEEMNVTYKLK